MTDLRKARAEHGGNDSLRLAAEEVLEAWGWDISEPRNKMLRERMEALRQALAHEALDRMVAENERLGLYVDAVSMSQGRVDETVKHKHEWVGLTEVDIYKAMDFEDEFDFAKAIEAKLKEKNT